MASSARATSSVILSIPASPIGHGAAACPVVGIGASAGGLEALTQFFENVPAGSGLAYVVVQHLDPHQQGMLPELLQRATTMKVAQVGDRCPLRPNHVYVIPPGSDLSLLHGELHLLAPAKPRGARLPIDFFFQSLAADQRQNSIGVVLSGMGRDGTLGLRAIRQKSGVTLVQDPSTARFDSMPRSVIEAGLADFIAPAAQLPRLILSCRNHMGRSRRDASPLSERTLGALAKIIILLRAHSGHDFTHYRRNTLHRRVERRMEVHQLSQTEAYVRYLQENPQELAILFKELLIGVTNFFRDPKSWRQLAQLTLPSLIRGAASGCTLRAWVAGCSTGEEAYTLAMVFVETLEKLAPGGAISLQIYATDLDKDAIHKARRGVFPAGIKADVSPARLSRFFVKQADGFRIQKQIRAMVVFAPQNLIMDPPFTKLDVLCCRNLLIYLTPELQRRILPLFHYCLNPGGVLFLGGAEGVGAGSDLFFAVAPQERIFVRNTETTTIRNPDFPAVFSSTPAPGAGLPPAPRSIQSLADRLLLSRLSAPAVLVNARGDIVYVNGRTGRYLEPAAGQANWNVIAMAREGLRYDLTNCLHKARRGRAPVRAECIKTEAGINQLCVNLQVEALTEPAELHGLFLITFADVAPPPAPENASPRKRPPAGRGRDLALELRRAHEELKTGREDMQTTQEELRSMNEELQSTNEELQSSNEELTTSKEEMHSLNEELQTVNAELQTKLDELSGANNDMKNLLNSTDIAIVFLDQELRVRRFTEQARAIIKLIPGDIGRPITDLASELLYPSLVDDAREVLRTLVFSESSIGTQDARWFKVRVMPYHTTDNRVDGVVITFTDITAAKRIEGSLREKNDHLVNHSAAQGRALGLAEQRLKRHEAEPAFRADPAKPGAAKKAASGRRAAS